jgi:nitroimidazol reductase NimA-like FMN-containing flavoprotein (pyridoxamine 5'-phosphate oxidase superfamily)
MSAHPVELTREECLDLLRGGVVGRVAMTTPDGPRIVPVNYAVHDHDIVFRTAPYSELGRQPSGTELAFEIDHLDHDNHRGWSVLALGRAEVVDDPDEVGDIRRTWDPRPWASGSRNLYVRLRWRELTGRRLGDDWSYASMLPHRRTV